MSRWFDEYGCDRVAEGLVVGAAPRDADDVAVLRGLGVQEVVSLVAEAEYEDGELAAAAAAYGAAGIVVERVPTADFGSLSAETLERASGLALEALRAGRTVYVHCRAGWQRSVVAAAATLARRDGLPPSAALEVVRGARAAACPLPHQLDDLERWWAGRDGAADGRPS